MVHRYCMVKRCAWSSARGRTKKLPWKRAAASHRMNPDPPPFPLRSPGRRRPRNRRPSSRPRLLGSPTALQPPSPRRARRLREQRIRAVLCGHGRQRLLRSRWQYRPLRLVLRRRHGDRGAQGTACLRSGGHPRPFSGRARGLRRRRTEPFLRDRAGGLLNCFSPGRRTAPRGRPIREARSGPTISWSCQGAGGLSRRTVRKGARQAAGGAERHPSRSGHQPGPSSLSPS